MHQQAVEGRWKLQLVEEEPVNAGGWVKTTGWASRWIVVREDIFLRLSGDGKRAVVKVKVDLALKRCTGKLVGGLALATRKTGGGTILCRGSGLPRPRTVVLTGPRNPHQSYAAVDPDTTARMRIMEDSRIPHRYAGELVEAEGAQDLKAMITLPPPSAASSPPLTPCRATSPIGIGHAVFKVSSVASSSAASFVRLLEHLGGDSFYHSRSLRLTCSLCCPAVGFTVVGT